jgi:hypothetical protein
LFIAAPPVPVTVRQRDTDGEQTGETKTFFRTVPVLDTLSRDRLGGVSRDSVVRSKTLDFGDEEIARRRG